MTKRLLLCVKMPPKYSKHRECNKNHFSNTAQGDKNHQRLALLCTAEYQLCSYFGSAEGQFFDRVNGIIVI